LHANAGPGHAHAHVLLLPRSEVLQRGSPKDSFEKSRIGRESDNGAAKDICRVLNKWREVVKDGVAPDSCTPGGVSAAMNARCPKDAEGAPCMGGRGGDTLLSHLHGGGSLCALA
jgi:hypothetical protein